MLLTGAEDKALQGCNLSADFGARPGRVRHQPPRRFVVPTWDGMKALNPGGLEAEPPDQSDSFLIESSCSYDSSSAFLFFACSTR